MSQPYRGVADVWPIPATFPTDYLCATIDLPDDAAYIQQFLGHINQLSKWVFYQREQSKSGTLAAQVWRNSINSLRIGCNPYPAAPMAGLPPWLSGGGNCWTVDAARLEGQLNIIQETTVCYDNRTGPGHPQGAVLVPPGEKDSMSNQPDFTKLQNQIDELQTQLANAQTSIGDAEMSISQQGIDIQQNRLRLDEQRQNLIASMRWYASGSNIPPGWVVLLGQTIDRNQPTISGDALLLYDRSPGPWKDTQAGTVTLPNSPSAVPVGFNPDLVGLGNTGNTFLDGPGLDFRLPVAGGAWHIYIGDASTS